MKKIFIIVSVFFFALLVAAELYVSSDSFALQIRPYVAGPLKEILGSDARVGWVRANLIPFYVEARDISLADQNGRETAAVRKIRVYINPLLLLLKKIHVSSVVLLEPRINWERTNDGNINLSYLANRIQSNLDKKNAKGPSSYDIVFKTITISQGRITFKDDMTGSRVSLSGIRAAAKIGENVIVTLKNAAVLGAAPACPEISGNLTASLLYDRGRVHVESLDLANADTVVSVSGSIGRMPDPELDLQLNATSGAQTVGKLTGLLKYLKKERTSRIHASAAVKGKLSDPSAEGVVTLAGFSYRGWQFQDTALSFRYQNRQLAIEGEKSKIARGGKSIIVDSIRAGLGYTPQGLDIQRCEIRAGDLFLQLSGRADPRRGFDAVLSAESRDAGRSLSFLASAPIAGNIEVKGNLTGPLNGPLFDGTFSAGPLIVRAILFQSAAGRLQYRDKKLSLVSADIHQQKSRFFFTGSVDLAQKKPVIAAKLKVIGSDVGTVVALFYKPLPLHFAATGDLSFNGTVDDFTGNGRLALDSGSAYGEPFTKGTITASLTRHKIEFPEVTIEKGSGTVKGTGWIGFDGTYSAAIESHGVRLAEISRSAGAALDGSVDLAMESSGTFSRPHLAASLRVAELAVNRTQLGGLRADLEIGDRLLAWKAELADKTAVMTGRLNLTKPYSWGMQTAVNAGSLDPFLIFGKNELSGRARLTAHGTMSLQGTGADISSLAGTASFDRFGFTVGDYQFNSAETAAVLLQGDRFSIRSFNLTGPDTKISLSGGGRLMRDVDLQLSGTANLSILRPLFAQIEHSDGAAKVTLTLRDSWNNPDVEGELFVKDGEIKIRDIPQKFSALTGKVTFDKSTVVADSLTGRIGGGTMTASAKARVNGLTLKDFSSKIVFENATMRFPEGLTSTLFGELYYDGDRAGQTMTGEVQIRRARYDKRVEWKSMLVDIGKGLYRKKKTEGGWVGNTQLNIRFYGADNIIFQNNLAKMPLDIDILVKGTVNRPQILGRIEARKGSVYFRQNEFKILHASADFVDPNRMNPILDIQAEIPVQDYLIRLAVSGSSDRAAVTLMSDPPLPDSDILALLALGKTGDQLRGKEADVGLVEGASFATGYVQDIFESRARSLTGLDRFQVDPYLDKGDVSVPRVTIGKELMQDKLYLTYSSNVGSTTPEQIFRIEYILNRHFSLVGERNELLGNTGADIKYRFEFK